MNINNLPVEILEHIFQYLSLHNLKNASMVCTQWNRAAFSWPNLRNVTLQFASATMQDPTLPALESSLRRYRNISLNFCDSKTDRPLVQYCCKILEQFESSLERLKIDWNLDDTPLELDLLIELTRSAQRIKELDVYDQHNTECEIKLNCPPQILSLKFLEKVRLPRSVMDNAAFDLAKLAPNAKHVKVTFYNKNSWSAIRTLNDQLLSLSLDTDTKGNFRYFWSMKPSKLQKLSLWRYNSDLIESTDVKLNTIGQFFHHCSSLTVLRLELKVPMEVIQNIVDSRLPLKSLAVYEVDDGWRLLSIVQHLEKLQILSIMEVSFDSDHPSIRNTRLPNLRHLTLDAPDFWDVSTFFDRLNLLTPNITTLQLTHYNKFCEESTNTGTLRSLFRSKMQRLQKLILFDFGCDFPSHLFNQLNLLPGLNELWVTCGALSPWSRSAIVPGVRRLAIDAPLRKFQLHALLNVFPSLTRFDVSQMQDRLDEHYVHRCEIAVCKQGSLMENSC